jgi:DNA polymerase-3 subunit delta'
MPLAGVVGHKRLVSLVSSAIERGTLPPSLLFVGPSGVGKWLVAEAIAQAVNCQTPVRGLFPHDACGVCRACDRVARGVHVDVVRLVPDDRASIKIDNIRETLEKTGYRPFEGKLRAILIRDADTLEAASQNALLKSLEEPPPGTMFILTTSVPGVLLPTVRSRCMRLRFGRLTANDVTAVLIRDHGQTEAEARAAAAVADGSVGQALAISDSDLTDLRDAAETLLQQSAGRMDVQSRLQAASDLVGPKGRERDRAEVAAVLRLAASMLRDIEAINAAADPAVLANPIMKDSLAGLARSYVDDRARTAFSAVERALAALDRNAGTKVVAEWLAVQL